MSRFVRSSKFRHVFGKQPKPDQCYSNIKVTRSAWDTNKISCNTNYFAVCWEAGGGGAFSVTPYTQTGKGATTPPLVTGHKAPVLDVEFHPFNQDLIASCSEDCLVKIWSIPEGGLTKNLTEAVQVLKGHGRKVGTVDFHPVANNVLATSSTDYTIKLWDIEKGANLVTIKGHTNIIDSVAWNYDGSQIATSCKDKKIRLIDPRSGEVTATTPGHPGVKGSRVVWTGKRGELFTVGFSRQSDRQYTLRDPKADIAKPKASANIDTSSGKLIPFYDNDSNLVFLAGKGDGNIRYYEITDQEKSVYFVSAFSSSSPQKGMAMAPKRIMDTSKCEIVRLYKVNNKNLVEPIPFSVPRKSEIFHADIYPDCYKGEAGQTADEWFAGANVDPVLMNLEDGYTPPAKSAATFAPVVKEEKVLTADEMKDEIAKLSARVAFLEAQLVKKDATIASLSA